MMSHFKLRDYQIEIVYNVLEHLTDNKRCCVSLATGGGKTVIFSELVNRLNGRTLICVHREELVHQTSKTLTVEHDLLLPKNKHISKDVCVAMVQTLHNRLKKNHIDINYFDNIIVDEAHRGEFMKILDLFNGKVIGFTATPNYEKNRTFFKCLNCGSEYDVKHLCCKKQTQKFKENIPLATYYDKLIEGIGISELIEKEYLVKDEMFVLDVDTSKLVYDPLSGDYTEESIALVFGSDEAIKNTINVYYELAKDKKTILFNPNTIVNNKLHKAMLEQGLPVKSYDSKNNEENRHDLVEWFKNTPNAILLNVQVFTTGFDCTDVEVVFLNKKTKSINLFLQMVGRGGRITDKILKPSFRVIDMGNNHEDFGNWSDKRDWNDYFYKKETKQVGVAKPSAVRTCESCESIISANSLFCPVCGKEKVYTNGAVLGLPKNQNNKPIIPSTKKIIEYCERNNLETLEARKIVYNYVSEMFREVSWDSYSKHKATGNLFDKTREFLLPYYFAINNSQLKGNKVITITHFTNETIRHIERRYHTITDFQMVS
jgi:superfamily II DNA or RNA helicase